MNSPATPQHLTEDTMFARVRARDGSADGVFYVGVLSTGIFCFPSCASRPALRENLRFYPSSDAATRAGFRPCRRCRPDLPFPAQRMAALVTSLCAAISAGEADFATTALAGGVSQARLAVSFRQSTGLTIAAFTAATRHNAVQAALQAGAAVTTAAYDAGFGSSGRFYAAADAMLGMTPLAYRAQGRGEHIAHAFGQTTLGLVLVAWAGRGICAILIGDDAATLRADLTRRFARAEIVDATPTDADYVAQCIRLIEEPNAAHHLPLDIRGTAFQRRVWAALREIPPGQTSSYTQIAAIIGAPKAARAVAGACAANALAVAVPCHRVVRGSGDLAGYRWGIARKRALLAREADHT